MATMNLRFAFEKETKGAVRFQEVGEDGKPAFAPSISTLYIRKSALPDGKIPHGATKKNPKRSCALGVAE